MKTIIAGSRNLKWVDVVSAMNACPWSDDVSEVVSGCARGVDRLGEVWAQERDIPVRLFPAQWETLGKRAGFVRNQEMAKNAEALVAVWDGQSKGTAHMVSIAKAAGLQVFVWTVRPAAALVA